MPANVVTIPTLQVGQKGSFFSQRLLQIPGHIINAPTGDGLWGSQYKCQLVAFKLHHPAQCCCSCTTPGCEVRALECLEHSRQNN